MAKLAVETVFGALSTYVYPGGYDSTKLGLGPLMVQNNGGGVNSWAGPTPIALARPMEASTQIPGVFPWVYQWSSTLDWVFLADNAATAATRRVVMYEYNRATSVFTWKGFITVTFPTATNHTIRGFRMTYDTYSTGTVGVTGTAVTGTSTAWQTARFASGARIGFGSTNPNSITTWYEISTITNDTSITLTGSAGSIASSTPYVIEELRAVILTTNATTTNGGLFVVKGLNHDTFQAGGTAIAAATTTDNVRASFWLADASTVTNITGSGLAIEAKASNTVHYVWALQGTTTMQMYKYNLRAALSLTSGKDTANGIILTTGVTATLTGTATQLNNGRLANLSHGPGSGANCVYFTTSTRIYRTADVSTISAASTTFLADNSTEVPPGSVNTFAATSVISSIEQANAIDKLVVLTSGAAGVRSYVTQYRTDGGQWDRIFLVDTKQIDQSSEDSGATPFPAILARAFSGWSEGGILYLAGIGTTAQTNLLYAMPASADWEYASTTNSRIVTPSISTPNADKYVRAYAAEVSDFGGATVQNLGIQSEPYRAYYRTTGISDNSGSWTLLTDSGDLSSVAGASAIQFMYEFRTIGLSCLPTRLISTAVVYNDLSTDSHYQPSVKFSDIVNKRFAWRFSTAFGSTVPALRVRLYDAVTGSLLVDDNTASPTGAFERSTDASTWSSWNNTDKGNNTTYLRYTPASLGDNIRVRALLTLN